MGRRREIAAVCEVLRLSRLVTLTGVGGVGKSRLALRAAHRVRRAFPDGVWLVELAGLRTPGLLTATVAETLGLVEQSAQDPASALEEYLADKRLLLVLDNCEHLVEGCAVLVERVLRAAPRLQVLTTSRWSLHVSGEQVWPVPPLSLSDPADRTADAASRSEAVALFSQRAAAVQPGFTVDAGNQEAVARLCQRLQGLPLAIELAAAWMRSTSPDCLLAQLDGSLTLLSSKSHREQGRYQTLRGTVDASYELCTAGQKVLWQRLSIFAGGLDLSAAEAVCADHTVPADDVLLGVSGLVDQSVLLRTDVDGEVRYGFLETLRQYGQEHLRESGDQPWLRRRHRDYFLRLAEQADADWFGPRQLDWLRRLHTEHANLQAALEYCRTGPGEAALGLRLASALWCYWIGQGLLTEGRFWLEQMLALDARPSRERARALWVLAWIAEVQGQPSETLRIAQQCRHEARELGDEQALAYATQLTGSAHMFMNNHAVSVPLLEQAMSQHRAAGVVNSITLLVLVRLGFAVRSAGDLERALVLLAQCRDQCVDNGERWTLSWALWGLGLVYWQRGEYDQASEHFRASLRIMRDFDDRLGIPFCVELLAWVAAVTGDTARAARLLGACPALWQPVRQPLFGSPALLNSHEDCENRARSALGDSTFDATAHDGAQLNFDDAVRYALQEPSPAPCPPSGFSGSPLTGREREIAELIALGLTDKDIATKLVISYRTVTSHVGHILAKLDATSRAQIATWTTRHSTAEHTT